MYLIVKLEMTRLILTINWYLLNPKRSLFNQNRKQYEKQERMNAVKYRTETKFG